MQKAISVKEQRSHKGKCKNIYYTIKDAKVDIKKTFISINLNRCNLPVKERKR